MLFIFRASDFARYYPIVLEQSGRYGALKNYGYDSTNGYLWLRWDAFLYSVQCSGRQVCRDIMIGKLFMTIERGSNQKLKKILTTMQFPFFESYKVCFKKTDTVHRSVIDHSSKSICVIKLSFGQNDYLMGGSFWQKDSLITHTLFKLWLITLLWTVSVFLKRTLLGM